MVGKLDDEVFVILVLQNYGFPMTIIRRGIANTYTDYLISV